MSMRPPPPPAPRAPRQPAKREPTAMERIQALAEQRATGNGHIIAPPEPLEAKSFREWLHAVAEVGAPGDVEIAWHHCQNAHIKGQLLNEYAGLREAAGRRYQLLQAAADREQQLENAAAAKRAEKARIAGQIAQYRAKIEELERKLALM